MADLYSLEALEECITVGGGSAKWSKAVYSLVQACNYHPNYHPMRHASTEPPPSGPTLGSHHGVPPWGPTLGSHRCHDFYLVPDFYLV